MFLGYSVRFKFFDMAKHINLINTLFIIIIFPVLAFLVKDYLVYKYATIAVPKAASGAPAALKTPEIAAYAAIVERPVFAPGPMKFRSLTAPGDTAGEEPASTVLANLTLMGTFSGKNGFIIIVKQGDPAEKTFRVGDKVFDAGVLKEVGIDSAVITRGGRDYTISIKKADIPPAPPITATQTRDNRQDNARGKRGDNSQGEIRWSSGGVKKTGEHEWAVDQKAVVHALDNIGNLLTDARLTPTESKDGSGGFLVNEIKAGGIFEAIGLQNGDILRRVNGFEITSPEKAIQVLTALRGESKIELDIVRGGQKMNFNYEIR